MTTAHNTGRPRPRGTAPLAVAGLAALALTVTGCAEPEDDTAPDHRSFTLSGTTLTIDSDDSSLELVPTRHDRVEVTRWFQSRKVAGSRPSVSWRMEDDRLVLRRSCSGFIASCALKHRVEVPRGTAVTVRNGDGSVRASNFRTALDIRTDDGSVRVEDVSGPVTLRSGDGSVRASGVRSRRIDAHTDDGSLHLALVTVPDRVTARSNDGSVTVDLPHGGDAPTGYRVSAGSEDGGVKVSVPRDDRSRHEVSAHSRDGSVTVRNAN
ncbi:DUF4097 family beta strand repeat-containing protein [Streptomyces sp. JNUCC 64]